MATTPSHVATQDTDCGTCQEAPRHQLQPNDLRFRAPLHPGEASEIASNSRGKARGAIETPLASVAVLFQAITDHQVSRDSNHTAIPQSSRETPR